MSYQIAEELFKIIEVEKDLLKIPTEYKSPEYFPTFVSNKLKDYYNFLKRNQVGLKVNAVRWTNNTNVQFLNKVRSFIESIDASINHYYNGKIAKAYERFNSSLDTIVSFRDNTVLRYIEPNRHFYKMRVEKQSILKNRSDNFHIRFDLRQFCKTQRYSVPGMPSLYLGDTAFVCFEEVDRPDYQYGYISRFESKKLINIIEIQTLDNFFQQYNDEKNLDFKLTHVLRFLLLYPLYVACTVKVQYNESFKPEYIIPQFLLQYVTDDENIRGIKFPSTKINKSNSFQGLITHNYVFPVTANQQDGFCPTLSSFFHLTRPRSFSDLIDGKRNGDTSKNYNNSDFYLIEQALLKEKTDSVLKQIAK